VLGEQFSHFIRREIGLDVNPHLMRHFAAFAYLEANPGDFESVRQMLGHKNIATTMTFYAKACTMSALARYDDVISAQLDAGSSLSLTWPTRKTAKRTKKTEEVD
jgi:integrase